MAYIWEPNMVKMGLREMSLDVVVFDVVVYVVY